MVDNNSIMVSSCPCSSTGQSNGLLNRRLQVRFLPRVHGAVAQGLERRPYKAGVVGSIPTSPTEKNEKEGLTKGKYSV